MASPSLRSLYKGNLEEVTLLIFPLMGAKAIEDNFTPEFPNGRGRGAVFRRAYPPVAPNRRSLKISFGRGLPETKPR